MGWQENEMHHSTLPESKADTVDEEDQDSQTEHTQQSIHSDLQVWQPSGGLCKLTLPGPWYLHLGRVATVVPRLAGAPAQTAAAASAGSFTARRLMGYGTLGCRADLINKKGEIIFA